MSNLLDHAVANNVAWCARVCRTHDVLSQVGEGWWVTLGPAPAHYPDAISLASDSVAATLPRMISERPWAAVKDSYGAVDLVGFTPTIQGSWVGGEPPPDTEPAWLVVRTADQFEAWCGAHGDALSIRTNLLADLDVRVLAAIVEDRPVAGAIAYRTGEVVGVSNVFTGAGHGWASLLGAVAGCFPDLPVVGWEVGDALDQAVAAGLDLLGPMRVLSRSAA